jgi:tetratricopeptide (TPR) repeat protein
MEGGSTGGRASVHDGAPSAVSHLLCLLFIALAAFLVYSNTFSAPFIFDDVSNIVENSGIQNLKNFWPPSGSRYFGTLSFAVNYYFGGLDVFGYHLVNLAIHISNAVLVYLLVILTFRTPRMSGAGSPVDGQLAMCLALVSSAVFAVHPVQTGAVTYVVQRFALLATSFYLLSIVLFIGSRLAVRGGYGIRAGAYIFSLLFGVLAMKTKEISFTLPVVIILYEFAFFGSKGLGRRALYLVPFLFLLPIIPLSVVTLTAPAAPGGTAVQGSVIMETLAGLPTKESAGLSRHDYLVTQFRVIVTYLRLLVLPINQNLDYDYPFFRSLLRPQVLLSFIFLLSILGSNAYLFARSIRTKNALTLLLSSGVFWFFITLSVESSVIPIYDVIFEHRLYMPSVGASIAFASAAFYVCLIASDRLSLNLKSVTIALLVCTALPLGVAAHLRNHVWKDEVTMYEDVVSKSPGKARAHNNLGMAYKDLGLLDKAATEFRAAISIKPGGIVADKDLPDIHYLEVKTDATNNLANVYLVRGMLGPAIEAYRVVLEIKPAHVEAHYNLAMACEEYGCLTEAIEHYQRFIELAPPIYSSYKEDARVRIDSIRARLRQGAG